MKNIVVPAGLAVLSLVSLLGIAACTVDAGVGGGPAGGTCDDITCADALGAGVVGDAICDATFDAFYVSLQDCACNGACPECDADLCMSAPMGGACASCIGAVCADQSGACGQN